MLSIDTLNKKPLFTTPGNESIIDLSAPAFVYKNDVAITKTCFVTDDMEMRADLVARVYYGDSNKLDYILKFNGISNPFALQQGTILLIGDAKEMEQNFTKETSQKLDDIRKRFFDSSRLSKKDQKRLELIKKKGEGASAAANLPPNMAEVGDKEIKVKDGVVVFGGDVVANKDNCPEVLSRAKVKSKLLENKIFSKK